MAEIIELQDENTEGDNQPTQAQQEPVAQAADNSSEPQVAEAPVVPEKYKGKSFDDLVRMHQEAEKLIGKHAQEVGEVRKLADELIKQQLNATQKDTQPVDEDNEIDYFLDPDKAVNHAVENNPVVKQLREQQEAQLRAQQLASLQQKFPDFQQTVASEDFANWIKSSKVRIDLFTRANAFDFDAAEELLDTYNAIKGVKAAQATQADETLKKVEADKRSQTLRAAAVQKGGTGEISKPVYRRVDLIRLRMQDPERYNAMQDDIMQAYAEGRVK